MEIAEAIILNVFDYDEADGIITALFKDGRVMSIYAQGIQKSDSKNRLNLMQFSVVEIEYFQKKDRNKAKLMRSTTLIEPPMKSLNDIHLLGGIAGLLEHRLAIGTKVYELVRFMIKEMEFRNLSNAFILKLLFEILKLDNIRLNMNSCVQCGNVLELQSFDTKRGGVFCKYCFDEHSKRLRPDTIKTIQEIYKEEDIRKVESLFISREDFVLILSNILDYYSDVLGLPTYLLQKI